MPPRPRNSDERRTTSRTSSITPWNQSASRFGRTGSSLSRSQATPADLASIWGRSGRYGLGLRSVWSRSGSVKGRSDTRAYARRMRPSSTTANFASMRARWGPRPIHACRAAIPRASHGASTHRPRTPRPSGAPRGMPSSRRNHCSAPAGPTLARPRARWRLPTANGCTRERGATAKHTGA